MTYQYEKFDQALRLLNGRLFLAGAPRFNLVVCGGSALAATGLITRTTKDVDVVALMDDEGVLLDPSPLPKALVQAAHEVALDLGLQQDWLNNGPSSDDGGLFRLGLLNVLAGRPSAKGWRLDLSAVTTRFISSCMRQLTSPAVTMPRICENCTRQMRSCWMRQGGRARMTRRKVICKV